ERHHAEPRGALEPGRKCQGAELHEVAGEACDDEPADRADERALRERLRELRETVPAEEPLEPLDRIELVELRRQRLEAECPAAERDAAEHARGNQHGEKRRERPKALRDAAMQRVTHAFGLE